MVGRCWQPSTCLDRTSSRGAAWVGVGYTSRLLAVALSPSPRASTFWTLGRERGRDVGLYLRWRKRRHARRLNERAEEPIGIGKIVTELFSAAISVTVWR